MLLRSGDADHVNKLKGYLDEFGKYCTYKQWFFGSLHEDRRITPRHTCVFNQILPIDQYCYEPKGPEQLEWFLDETEEQKVFQELHSQSLCSLLEQRQPISLCL